MPVELLQKRRGDPIGDRARLDELQELTAGRLGDVDERAERPRSEERVTGPDEEPCVVTALLAKSSD